MGSHRRYSTKRPTLNQAVRKDVGHTNDVIESMRRLDRSMDDVTYTYLGTTLTERLWFEIKKFGRAVRRELFYGVWAALKVTLILLFNIVGAVLIISLIFWLLSIL